MAPRSPCTNGSASLRIRFLVALLYNFIGRVAFALLDGARFSKKSDQGLQTFSASLVALCV